MNKKLEYLKELLPDGDEIQLKFALGRTEELIKNYTNNSTVPDSVFYTHIEMALMYYKFNEELNRPSPVEDTESEGSVESITEGDTTVKFGSVSSRESTAEKMKQKRIFEDSLLNDFRVPLHSIRKMRW